MMSDRYDVVAAADPNPERLEMVRKAANNPDFRTFTDDRAILAEPKLADVMIIGTQDAYHKEPCLAAMQKGYDILLEKPIAQTMADVVSIEAAARRLGRKVLVCHVLRYSPFYQKVKEIITSGVLGDIISLNATEGVGTFHQAHSFVRGHWGVVEKATPMIIAKSCHDMDIIYWLLDRKCEAVASFGGLNYFTKKYMPADAPPRCTDGCPVGDTCVYNAELYLTKQKGWLGFVYDRPKTATDDEIRQWLATSPWGRCVYQCDNTAVDHQVVSMKFTGNVTVTFTMTAFDAGRNVQIYGTKARLIGGEATLRDAGSDIIVTDHTTRESTPHKVELKSGGYSGHGGGDAGLMDALYSEMMKDRPEDMHSSIQKSVESHLMGFAAEESRVTGQTIRLDAFYKQFGGEASR
jgi:predicted dehydrogenase